eukprot:Blabericola_migrator_1__12387@NODE_778_length_6562_cov_75_694072_g553_i0_p3_GENE_NODE_778_length_6562_cov_75_694072_g553_i0NODE_778_length_6562_cov_75_694072_g553_i0_p3_ORF_typecomplete_len391_score33_43PrsWprotease/PF13367_6/7_8e03PrsWprotease/PF13367_6/2_2e27DUF3397/PF11877_8/0_039DUF3397/PF11877_8/6_2e03DUF3397/PF11877_8/7_1e03_NODE_778_length_6562_cov_75_694072_g553_i035154687
MNVGERTASGINGRRFTRSINLKGADWAIPFTLTLIAIITVAYLVSDGLVGPFLLYLAILPVVIVLCILRYGHEKDISVALMCEMVASGAVVAIGIATVLEGSAQSVTRPIWQCQKSIFFTWQCDVLFGIAVTICVGLVEEFAKFFPVSRLRRRLRYVPYTCDTWWYRLVETPYGLAMGGCASAAGFACVENIKYIIVTGRKDIEHGITTSFFRAFLAIPFHIACTGWAASRLSREWYFRPTHDTVTTADRSHPEISTWDWLRQYIWSHDLSSEEAPMNDDYHAVANPDMVYRGVSIWRYLKLLCVPVSCHGLYDTGLFLGTQFITASQVQDKLGELDASAMYQTLASISIIVSLTAYLSMITIFCREYFWNLADFQLHAIPRLHHNYDC